MTATRFRIRPDANFTKSFRRAAAGALQHAITLLEQRPDGTHEAIHDFRRDLKKVRSLYRLVASDAREFQKRENARLRDAARGLSAIRDAEALIGTVQYLREHARDAKEAAALKRIAAILETRRNWMTDAETGIETRLLEASAVLKEAIDALDKVDFANDTSKTTRLVVKGWKRTGQKARDALESCRDDASADAFHELRKRTQDYRAHLGVLTPLWPSAMKAKQAAAKDLVDRLGHIHDLSVLSDLVESEPELFTRTDDLARLLEAVIHRQQEDRRAALIAAEAVFDDEPRKEARHIGLLWEAAAK